MLVRFISLLLFASIAGCQSHSAYKTIGSIERMDPALDAVISENAKTEIIAEGFEWSEGPLWIDKEKMLLFSDVPTNTIHQWTEEKGTQIYLKPSGYTGAPAGGKEPGSNGLLLDPNGKLVLCQHGDRRMASMEAEIKQPAAKFITLADKYNGQRFSSPNDAVYNDQGELFFTDPPYGLGTQDDSDPQKEIPFNGVYRLAKDGMLTLISDSLSRPNGLAFFPGGRKLLVANSDPAMPNWYLFFINPADSIFLSKLFFSAAGFDKKLNGLPDGLKIDKQGNVFASGPGGLLVFNSDGKLLGKIKLEHSVSNCALSADEKTLYITNDMYVLRLRMRN